MAKTRRLAPPRSLGTSRLPHEKWAARRAKPTYWLPIGYHHQTLRIRDVTSGTYGSPYPKRTRCQASLTPLDHEGIDLAQAHRRSTGSRDTP